MPLQVPCPHCDHVLKLPRLRAGRTVRCPKCDATLEVPNSSPPRIPRSTPASPQEEATSAGNPIPPPIQHQPAKRWVEPEQSGDGPNRLAEEAASHLPTPPPLPKASSRGASPGSDSQSAQSAATHDEGRVEPETTASKPPPLSKLRSTKHPGNDHSDAEPAPAKQDPDEAPHQAPKPVEVPADPAANILPVRGYEHSADQRWTVYQLGASLALAALFGAVPAVLDIVAHFQAIESPGISRWAWVLLLASGIQLAYAAYLFQLPDWSSVWTVSIVMLVFATAYAMLLGLLLLADRQSQVIRFLELTDARAGHKATGWCLIMLSICSLLAYFSGRISSRWQHAYRMVTENGAAG